jgi:hypothetical protein
MELGSFIVHAIDVLPEGIQKNFSLADLPPEIISNLGMLISIFKAAGIVLIVYLAFLMLKGVLNFKKYRKIKKMHNKINEIDMKLDLLLGKKNLKVETKIKKVKSKAMKKKKKK